MIPNEQRRKKHREYMRKYRKTAKNKEYMSKYQKDWVKSNPEKHKAYCKKWRVENWEYYNQIAKKWKEEDPERFNRYMCSWRKKKLNQDSKFKLDSYMGNKIRESLKGRKNGRRWEGILGYKLEDLVIHLERQFDDNMTWENYGSYWHIDHVKPKSLFKYNSDEDEEFKKCWSLSNLQPLEAFENYRKGNSYKQQEYCAV